MKKIIISSTLAALLCTTAIADTSSMNSSVTGMGILENDYVKAGVNGTTGTFGSGGGTRPGLQFDSTGTGTFPADSAQGDYLTPGSPFDGLLSRSMVQIVQTTTVVQTHGQMLMV